MDEEDLRTQTPGLNLPDYWERLLHVKPRDASDFDAFVAARYRSLVGLAYSLTGSIPAAEDLVQESLVNVWRSWSRILADDPHTYVRATVVRSFASSRRRLSAGEIPTLATPDHRAPAADSRLGDADELLQALLTLPPQMRAVVVLRFREDLSEKAVAELLGCSLGSVKSQGSRGLARLREALLTVRGTPE